MKMLLYFILYKSFLIILFFMSFTIPAEVVVADVTDVTASNAG